MNPGNLPLIYYLFRYVRTKTTRLSDHNKMKDKERGAEVKKNG